MSSSSLYIGLMTGTSVDGIDAVLARLGPNEFTMLASDSQPLDPALRKQVLALCQPGESEIDRAGPAHRALGQAYAHAVQALLKKSDIEAQAIRAIGCHGQTVRHRPGQAGFSLQLGCPDTLAALTGIAVISNFRNKDMVLGGQGAPLVPRFHEIQFGNAQQRVAVINIGGMANATLLDRGKLVGGFDTGPGNVLMDLWIQRHQDQPYDSNGDWAASGETDTALLTQLLKDPYFYRAPPKSTGREDFNGAWLDAQLSTAPRNPADIQTTLADLTAHSLADALADFAPQQIYLCGGGAHNGHLRQRLAALTELAIHDTGAHGLDPDWVEASAFAWLAWARLAGETGNAPVVTGASRPAVLGQVTLP